MTAFPNLVWPVDSQLFLVTKKTEEHDTDSLCTTPGPCPVFALWFPRTQPWRAPGDNARFDPLDAFLRATSLPDMQMVAFLKLHWCDKTFFRMLESGV